MNNNKEFNIGDRVYFKFYYRVYNGTIIAKNHPVYIIKYTDCNGNIDVIDRRSDYYGDSMILMPNIEIQKPEKIEKKKSWWQKLFN